MRADPGWGAYKGTVAWSEWLFVAAETVGGVAPRAHAFLNDANDATVGPRLALAARADGDDLAASSINV